MADIHRITGIPTPLAPYLVLAPVTRSIQRMGWRRSRDALHVACAERAGATVLLTTDDTLINIMSHHSDTISIRIVNPVQWYEEVTGNESEDLA